MKLLYNLRNLIFILLGFAIPVSVAFTNFLIIIFTVIWLVEGDFSKKFSYLKSLKWLWSIIGLILFYFFALLYGENHDDALYVIQRISLLLFFIPLATTKFNQSTYSYAVLTFLLTNLLSALVAVGINFDVIEPIVSSSSTMPAFILYNYHNILLSFSSLLSFSLFTKSKSRYSFIYLLFIIIYSASIFSEAGRAGQLTFNIFFIAYAIYFLKKKILYSVSILGFLIVINLFSYNSSGIYKHRVDHLKHIIQNNGQKKNQKSSEKDIRYVFASESLNLILKRPFFGYGTGSFTSTFRRNTQSNYMYYEHKTPHNNFLYIFFELGCIGLLIFLSIFYFQIKDLLQVKLYKLERLILPFFYLFLMLFDAYLFIFTITIFYIFMHTIYKGFEFNEEK